MKILIIGGTKFLGRHLLEAAKKRNHQVTLFNRGKESDEVFENTEQIFGDRNSDLNKLKNKSWDALIDTCGYLPQTVKFSAESLKDSVKQYVFISSISAYRDFSQPDFDENAKLAELTAEQEKEVAEIDPKGELNGLVLGENYGALKALCEKEIEKVFPHRTLIIRSGLIVGKYDWTDRLTYWLIRTAQGGEVLAPANPQFFIQFIDAQDLAQWTIKAIENQVNGVFNVTGKANELTLGKLLDEVKVLSGSNAKFTWVSEKFLQEEKVSPWSEMPLYLPESEPELRGFLRANINRALAEGLTFRPLSETISETLAWRKNFDEKLKAGISTEKELELLRKWKNFERQKF